MLDIAIGPMEDKSKREIVPFNSHLKCDTRMLNILSYIISYIIYCIKLYLIASKKIISRFKF